MFNMLFAVNNIKQNELFLLLNNKNKILGKLYNDKSHNNIIYGI